MSNTRGAGREGEGKMKGRRCSIAEACMCGAEMVAECPIGCGESE